MDAYDIATQIMRLWRENVSLGESSGLIDKNNLRVPIQVRVKDKIYKVTLVEFDDLFNEIVIHSKEV